MDQAAVKPVRLSGVDVCFPHEPYGVQKVFMAQVVRAVDHEENALLEAPTGCGKTLSLLCGALAWQTAAKEKKAAAEKAAAEKAAAHQAAAEKAAKAAKHDPIEDTQDEEGAATSPGSGRLEAAKAAVDEPPEEPIIVPKIYYATRTHSQIAQVVRELKRTIYRPRMAVLGARPHYCINTAVIRKGNIDAECEELLKDGMGCKYKKNANSIGHGHVKVHDIEDLAKIGKRHTACPYFVARHLADSADLVFCPYSYLLDPNIRRSTRIIASDAILIFDEAHNIEDQAREAGTMEIELEQLKGSVMSLVMAANSSAEGDTYRELSDAVLQLINWMLALADGNASGGAPGQGFKAAGFESFERIWTGQQMLSALTAAGLGAQEVEHLWACYEKAKAAEEKAGFATEGEVALEPVSADVKTPRAGGNALGCVASLLSVLRLMYGTYTEAPSAPPPAAGAAGGGPGTSAGGGAAAGGALLPGAAGGGSGGKVVQSVPGVDHVADYRLAVQMWLPRDTNHNNRGRRDRRRPDPSTDGFAETTGVATTSWAFRFCLWCLNPAVVFRSLSHVARSVLLTSGTLSPLESFSGELGLDFHVRLEAPHVVDVNRQVFSRVVSHGLDGRRLRATYKEADQLEYQDSLGQLLLAVAATVPDGLLLFLPSYALMEKLSKRWQDTGLMGQLQRIKAVFSEPRAAGDAFDTAIRRYYEAVDGGQGGLFMAVCRGKVSEGIDFADDRARCVMVVGIPYPHAKDSKVALKKDYNNASAAAAARHGMGAAGRQQYGAGAVSSRGGSPPKVLTGDAWYSQQAFRALNQAIGRCIRHRLDYGAILLVDERFKEGRNQASLSKWVRGSIQPAASTQGLLQHMAAFFTGLAACPPGSAAAAAAAAAAAVLPPALPIHLQQQQLVKPGYEQQPAGEQLLLVKPGFQSGPPMHSGAQRLCKPGFEAAPGMAGCAGGVGPGQCCCAGGSDACSKPGFEPYAAAGGGQDADARSRWQQQPQLVPGGKQPWQQQQQQAMPPQHAAQQQQQQHKPKLEAPQQGPGRGCGPMDAFLVEAGAKQQQQQQKQQVGVAVKQEQLQPGPSNHPQQPQQPQQQAGQQGMPVVPPQGGHSMWPPPGGQHQQQQQHSGLKQQVPMQDVQQQQQQQGRGQAVSCLTALQGMQLPSPHAPGAPQQHAWGQQQQQGPGQQGQQQHPPFQPLDCNVPTTPAAGSASTGLQGQLVPGSAGKTHPPAAGTSVAGTPQQQQQKPAGQPAGGRIASTTAARHSEATAANTPAVAAAATAAVAAGEGSSVSDLQQCASHLGLSLPLVQQWLAADMASMTRCLLQQQQAAAAAAGLQMQQLCSFGLMASFDKALEACQQQQPHQPGSDAASSGGSSMAPFWRQWHSYVPTGLVVAAAAAGQPPPEAVVAQADRGQWQGPWLQTMQQQDLQHTLTAMAGLYDQLIEQQQQQQQAGQNQTAGTWVGDVQPPPPGQLPQYRQQQPPQWNQQPPQQHHQQQWNQQPQQPYQQLPPHWNQQQQQHALQQPGMPPPSSSRPPHRSLPASMRQQQQHPAGGGGGAGSAQGPGQQQQQQQQRPQLKLQLSQSVKQPKRAAVLSATAQKAIQKRSKVATAGQAVARPPPPGQDSSDDDDEFF